MWGLLSQSVKTGLMGTRMEGNGYMQSRFFKVVSALRRRCNDCKIVKRGKKLYVLCNTHPRHKQRQGRGGAIYRKTG